MPAIISDQFRILNAANFVAGVGSTSQSYTLSLDFQIPMMLVLVMALPIGTLIHQPQRMGLESTMTIMIR